MMERFASMVQASLTQGDSVKRIAITFALGTYIAFCPFIGFHTVLTVCLSLLFKLNMPLMLIVSNLINNPWTLVPVYASGYAFGQWIFSLLGIDDMIAYNPYWMNYLNSFLANSLGLSSISLWSFIVGGNLLGIGLAIIVYPIAKLSIMRLRCATQTY